MAAKKKTALSAPSKKRLWLKFYLDVNNTSTFFNKTESARRAGYKTKNKDSLRQIGCHNFKSLSTKISKWLDDNELSENALKIKLLTLLDAKETKFFKATETDQDGQVTGIMIKEVEVDAIETQRKTLQMAIKMKGMDAPSKLEISGDDGGPLVVEIVKFGDVESDDKQI